jgi:hypothetical protein
MGPRAKALLFGFGVGAALGTMLSQRSMGKYRSDLFSPSPLRRLSALGYLNGHPSVEGVQVLHDYLAWENRPILRRRAERVVRRMEAKLG